MDDIHIITVATESKYYLPYLKKSCNKNGKDLKILGYNEIWKGFNWRFRLILNYLEKLNKEDIICIIDGYDVICTRNLKTLKNVFLEMKKKYKCKIIIGYDNLQPNDIFGYYNYLWLKYYFSTCNNISLNAGTYIGQVKDLLIILKEIYNLNPNDKADDQVLFTKYCNINSNDIYIDINNEIFLTIDTPRKEVDKFLIFENNKIKYKNNYPFFIHGPGQTFLDNIIIKLNYEYDYLNPIKKKLNDDFYKVILYKLTIFLKFLLLIIIVIILIYIIFIFTKKLKIKKIILNS